MFGIIFNGKHSFNDFGLYVEEQHILPPAKIKITASVPFMSGYYDFSTIGSNGQQNYAMRTITVKLALLSDTRQGLYVLYTQILEWLIDVGQSKLIFDFMPDFYFLAEAQGVPTWDEFVDNGDLDITFICNPFKYSIDYPSNPIWDTFNFNVQVLQDSEFDVVGNKTVIIYNPGRVVTPIINVNSVMNIILNNATYNLAIGDNTNMLKLVNDINTITINGTGHIKFLFKEELI